MNRKPILISIVLLLLLMIGGLGYLTSGKIQRRRHAKIMRQTLPTLQAWSVDSTLVQYQPPQSDQPTVIFYFNSECHICQYEAQAIRQDSVALKHANLVMISSEPLATIRTFATRYGLDQRPNIRWLGMDPVAVTRTFGAVSVPSIFIYNPHRQLVKHYRGETKMEAIVQHL